MLKVFAATGVVAAIIAVAALAGALIANAALIVLFTAWSIYA